MRCHYRPGHRRNDRDLVGVLNPRSSFMALFALNKELIFPPVELAEPDGLLAVGGDLSRERLLLAYRSGIFPWYEGEHILWWSPDPRCVLFPDELKVSKSMRQLIRKDHFEFTIDRA